MPLTRKTFLLSTNLLLCLSLGLSLPPDEPVKCSFGTRDCTVTNSAGSFPDRSVCKAGEVAYPTNEAELMAVVAGAARVSRKMRVVTRLAHSIPKLVCMDGDDGLLISTKKLDRIVGVDRTVNRMTVEGGVMLKELIKVAANAGLALAHSPYWSGVTIGGLLSTGAHGSSLRGKGSAVHEYVVGIRLISPGPAKEGYVVVRDLNASDPDFDAVKVSLGVLGVISEVTLQLEPLFKRSITFETKDDHDLTDQVTTFGQLHEYGDFVWYPNLQKVIYKIDDRVPLNVSGNGRYDYPGFRPTTKEMLEKTTSIEENIESAQDTQGKCSISKLAAASLQSSAFGFTNDGVNFTGYPIIGYQNELQSCSSCLDGPKDTVCSWDPRVKSHLFYQMSLSVPLSSAKDFLDDLKRLFNSIPESTCSIELYNGFLVRYVKASSAYLGKQEDSIEFDITYYRSRDPTSPRLFEDVLEEVEQMAAFKYGGLPHWGKNRNVAFVGAAEKYGNVGRFLEVKERYDPMGLFSSRWTDLMLGLREGVTIMREGCALDGLCICSEDRHCAPSKGYFCRSGRVYKEARVCSLIDSAKHTEL